MEAIKEMEIISARRARLAEMMEDNSVLLLYAGLPVHVSEDEYYPFEVNRQFCYLTGLTRENQALVISKLGGEVKEYLFIEEPQPKLERWIGKMPTREESTEISGIQDVRYMQDLSQMTASLIGRNIVQNLYMETHRYHEEDLEDYNLFQARRMMKLYPMLCLRPIRPMMAALRTVKDEQEIACFRKAVDINREGLEEVLRRLKPGMTEYQVQAVFEGTIRYQGAEGPAFATIAAGGKNACSMHYGENSAPLPADGMILLDLGAKYRGYGSDVSRTYPVSGRFTERQKEIYALVLKANKAIAAAARPGVPIRHLTEVGNQVLGEGLVQMGMIEKAEDAGKYSIHGFSHPIGLDTHDLSVGEEILQPGWIISDEPGLYIDDEALGVRIEDDLLITEDGCEVLTEGILREIEDIEAFMEKR